MHVYIAPEPGNPVLEQCTVLIIIPDSNLFPPNTHLNSQGGIQRIHAAIKGTKALLKHIAITSCQVLIYEWVNQSPHDGNHHCSFRSLEPAILRLRVLHSN